MSHHGGGHMVGRVGRGTRGIFQRREACGRIDLDQRHRAGQWHEVEEEPFELVGIGRPGSHE